MPANLLNNYTKMIGYKKVIVFSSAGSSKLLDPESEGIIVFETSSYSPVFTPP